MKHYVAHARMAAALPADRDRSRLRRGHREPLLRRRGRSRVGGAVVLGQRLEVGRRIGRRFRCCSRRKCCRCRCSCGSTMAIATAWRARERVDGYDCYVVRFEPVRQDERALSRHRLDRREDVRADPRAGGPGRAVGAGGLERGNAALRAGCSSANRPVFLFSGLTARQIMLIAGRNLLVEKRVGLQRLPGQRPGASSASARRRARATGSCSAETDRGLRYYVKERGRRVVSDRATKHAKAHGDGRHARSVVCVSAADLRHQLPEFPVRIAEPQLAILFAGVLAAGNIQRSKIGDTHLDASVDFFAIAVPSSDRVYGRSGERTASAC